MSESNSEDEQNESISWRAFLSSSYFPSLALVCLAVWLHAADALLVATMLPSIVGELGGSGLVAWNVTLYLTTSILAGTASALITIKFGLKVPMSLAAIVFGLGCLISAVAPSMAVVLLGRAIQGFGGGALVSMSFIATRILFPSNALPRALAAVSTLWGASALLGPLIGGIFVEFFSWRWGFGFFAIQAFALSVWITFTRIQSVPTQSKTDTTFPWGRLGIISIGIMCIAYAGVNVALFRSSAFFLVGLAFLIVSVYLDSRTRQSQILPASPFDPRHATGAALLLVLCMCVATVTNSVFGTLLLTKIYGISALTAGYVLAASALGWTMAAFTLSGSPQHKDARNILLGIFIVVLSLIGFAITYPTGPVWVITLFSFAGGAGFGMAWAFILRKSTSGVTVEESQRITNAITTVQRVGYALGAALIGIVANALGFENMASAEEAGYIARWLFISCLPIAIVGLVATIMFVKR